MIALVWIIGAASGWGFHSYCVTTYGEKGVTFIGVLLDMTNQLGGFSAVVGGIATFITAVAAAYRVFKPDRRKNAR